MNRQTGYYAAAGSLGKVLRSRSLRQQGLLQLAAKKDMDAALDFLRNSAYKEVFPKEPLRRVLRPFEHRIKQVVIEDARKLVWFMPLNVRNLIHAFIQRYEVANIKTLLGTIYSEGVLSDVMTWLFELGEFATFDIDPYVSCRTVNELVAALGQTQYGRPLQEAMNQFSDSDSLFYLEYALDSYYYHSLWERVYRANHSAKESKKSFGDGTKRPAGLLSIVQTEIDVRNLQWAARFRLNFEVPADVTATYLLEIGYFSDRSRREQLASLENLEDIKALVPPYMAEAVDELSVTNLTRFSKALERYLYRLVQDILHRNPYSLEGVLAHLYWRQFEVSDVTTVVESKRYQLPASSLMELLYTVDSVGEA